jgi:hypothetical protein
MGTDGMEAMVSGQRRLERLEERQIKASIDEPGAAATRAHRDRDSMPSPALIRSQ